LPLSANGGSSILYDGLGALAEMTGRDRADAVLALGVSGGGRLPRCARLADAPRGERGRAGRGARQMGRRWRAGSCPGPNGARSAPPMPSSPTTRPSRAELSRAVRPAPAIIAYGADHANKSRPPGHSDLGLPPSYALAIARAEPENNLEVLIRAFTRMPDRPLVIVANWSATRHGRCCARPGRARPNLHLVEAEYDPGRLRAIRDRAWLYLHGHSAGGTNPRWWR
jgi:hypothetical protein